MAEPAHPLPPAWDPSIPPRPLRPADVSPPPRTAPALEPTTDGAAHDEEHRRLLVGNLVVRRLTYRSVARVAWPFFGALYAVTVAAGVVVWNVAALLGWSPGTDGVDVAWAAVVAREREPIQRAKARQLGVRECDAIAGRRRIAQADAARGQGQRTAALG